MKSICGADCNNCGMKKNCKGCIETDAHPFGGRCAAGECYKNGGKKLFCEYKKQLIEEFNSLDIPDMPKITELCTLKGEYINLEYALPNGQQIKLLEDNNIYLGYQAEKKDSDRCYGLAADDDYLLICEYGCGGAEPQIVIYRRR
ncbi:MAG: DUF3795 domain-containing protein [bacterium]|nr:DUF3795 domain-containing protein [bacterium]